VECTTGACQVGAHPSNDAVLKDPQASRFHCEVRLEEQRAIVRDLGSTNGTFVDGVRVREAFLRQGSTLTVGTTVLRFALEDDVSEVPVSEAGRFGTLVGNSSAMRQVFSVLERAARSDATVLLEGETGTGKSRAALALHNAGARADKPFLVVDCGALPPTLLEAELFGHEKGAFTGATSRRLGVFEEARGGTVLLDEIGEVPLELQPRLLRVLEDRQIRRLGQNQWTQVDVRIVAATHRDLRAEVNTSRFRSDLYFRLAVVRVTLPPLRAHPEDLRDLAKELFGQLGASPSTHPDLYTPAFFSRLTSASWPGNVRELRNYLERCLVFEAAMPMGDDPPGVGGGGAGSLTMDWRLPLSEARKRAIDSFEREYVEQALARHAGKVSQAALEADVDRVYLYRLMRKHGIKPGE
jgi:DNA-binding NtrC family response regulator